MCLRYFTTTGGWPVCFSNNWRPGSSLSFHHTSAGCKFSPFHTSGRLPLSLRLSTLTLMFVMSFFLVSARYTSYSRGHERSRTWYQDHLPVWGVEQKRPFCTDPCECNRYQHHLHWILWSCTAYTCNVCFHSQVYLWFYQIKRRRCW